MNTLTKPIVARRPAANLDQDLLKSLPAVIPSARANFVLVPKDYGLEAINTRLRRTSTGATQFSIEYVVQDPVLQNPDPSFGKPGYKTPKIHVFANATLTAAAIWVLGNLCEAHNCQPVLDENGDIIPGETVAALTEAVKKSPYVWAAIKTSTLPNGQQRSEPDVRSMVPGELEATAPSIPDEEADDSVSVGGDPEPDPGDDSSSENENGNDDTAFPG